MHSAPSAFVGWERGTRTLKQVGMALSPEATRGLMMFQPRLPAAS